MTDLTEKWKNGELEKGWYYIKVYGKVEVARLSKYNQFYNLPVSSGYVANKDIMEVLAPVPSYAEWWKLNQLLGKCYRFLRLTETKVEAIENVKRGLVKEIDEVLK